MIDEVVTVLDDLGVLDNTYIFYTSDNGGFICIHNSLWVSELLLQGR